MTACRSLSLLALLPLVTALHCDRRDPSAPPRPEPAAVASVSSTVAGTGGDASLGMTSPPTRDLSAAPRSAAPGVVRDAAWSSVLPEQLCVTSGAVTPTGEARFLVDAPTFRATAKQSSETRAELVFTYLGATATTRALGSGAVRRQLGLKLRAGDPCNLVYVMWRLDPTPTLVVSLKQNPGQRTSAECKNRGYSNVRARSTGALPAVAEGSTHVLRAEMSHTALRVFADGGLVWEGDLGAAALEFDGPIGVRSDNVRLEAELLGATASTAGPCDRLAGVD